MFYNCFVVVEYRDYIRFFWYEDNDLFKFLIDYYMIVYVFGNSLFFVVVIYGLCKVVEKVELDVQDFIYKNFYVDDGLLMMNF